MGDRADPSRPAEHAGDSPRPSHPESGPEAARPEVSVVIPTLNGQPAFARTVAALRRQSFPGAIEIIVIDSGSTDGTLETAARSGARLLHVEKDAFDHGDTRNLAIHHARGPFIVLLSQDAEPMGERWLESIVRPLREDDEVAGVCGRLLPRPGMDLLLRRGVEDDLNHRPEPRTVAVASAAAFEALTPYEKRLHLNFHDVGSCLRRSVWERLPLPRTPFGEDLMWAKAVVENGHKLVYEPRAEVLHAHDYTLTSIYRRAWWDGWLNRRLLNRPPVERFHHVLINAARGVVRDYRYLARQGCSLAGRIRALPRSIGLEVGTFLGFYRGATRTVHRPDPRVPGPARPLRILYVVHGFPPEDLAGTEVHTLTVARSLQALGHHVAVFHRCATTGAAAASEPYPVEAAEHEGIPVYRLANKLRYHGIEETYVNRHVEDRFLEVLARERPDVVHFQHCLHTSVSLISRAEDLGYPTVVTLHDYWFICPTVQMVLPDRSVCRVRRAGIACVRCARNPSVVVRLGQMLVRCLGPFAALGPAVYGRLARRVPRIRRDLFDDARALMLRPHVTLSHLRRAGRALSPSRFLRGRYLEFGLDREQVVYQRIGIDTTRFKGLEKAPRSGPLRVGFIGSFVWYKGLHVLIEAFRRLRPDEAVLTVWGNPEQPPEVRDYAAACRRSAARAAAVHFAGPLPQRELAEAHRELDVLVVPSLWFENSPLVILEALAARTPVVASDLGGMAELIEDGKTGCLFPVGDAIALRQRILDLARSPSRVEAMAAAIRPPKDVVTTLAELELVYRQEVSRPRPAAGRVPFWSAAGGRFSSFGGTVDIQGDDLALLRPRAGGGSSIRFEVPVSRPGAVRFEVLTCLIPGETDVVLSGSVFVNDNWVGEISPHRMVVGEALVRCHRFVCDCPAGTSVLTLASGREGDGDTASHLRIQRVQAFHESEEDTGCLSLPRSP